MTDPSPGATVAVVDDDSRILKSLQNLLESADHNVFVFASAAALIESGCLATIDCLISDIDMPVVDGLELLRVVRATRPTLPVFLITGHPELLTRLPSIDASHSRAFTKPFDGQQLLTAIGDALQNRQVRGSES